MSAYKAYHSAKEVPSRRTRKGERNTTFLYNHKLNKKLKKEASNGR